MRILLISANREKSPCPAAPIGLAYVASSILKDGHEVEILDLCFAEDVDAVLQQAISGTKPDIIGLSIRNVDNLTYPRSIFYLPDIKAVADRLKPLRLPIVVGGSGFSLFPEAILRYLGLEFGIIGEGEIAFREFVRRYEQHNEINGISNLVYLKDGGFHSNPINHMKDFSSPARQLLDNERYFKLGGMGNIQTKRGCPFKCIYCTYPYLNGNRIRCRSEQDIVDELEEVKNNYGIDYIFFIDDIFNHPIGHAIGICKEIIRRGLQIDWACFVTPKGMTFELLKLMKQAGCKGIEFGTDAATVATISKMGKSFTLNEIRKVSAMCDDAGLETAHYLILGGPGETEETLEQTFAFMAETNPKAVIAMTGVRIYPNTGLETLSIKEGVIKKGEDILSPRFYLSSLIGEDVLLSKIKEHALQQPNWVVPGQDIRNSEETMAFLRQLGNRGPLWNMLKKNIK
ncbi:MAG: cobalamin B12-binding domain-containing protein [Deltaproteobacteria bacterium]|nr:cobalamin B12-binding domain-containing protein [Deltaproteobacteria bacterium]